MIQRCLMVLGLFLFHAASGRADPPVTSSEAPSPGPEVARRWLEAIFQAPLLAYGDKLLPRSEAVRMFLAVDSNQKLGLGVGWYDPSQTRHDWAWLVKRFDANGDQRISPQELEGPNEFFKRLDRDGDGLVTRADLDWSPKAPWVRQDAQALRLLRNMDGDGNGRLTEKEWLDFYHKIAKGKEFLTPQDLRQLIPVVDKEPAKEKGAAKKVSKEVWLKCLFAGDVGSPMEGPRVGHKAPDFTLPTMDGKKFVTLSDQHGKKPVVLIFGSFT